MRTVLLVICFTLITVGLAALLGMRIADNVSPYCQTTLHDIVIDHACDWRMTEGRQANSFHALPPDANGDLYITTPATSFEEYENTNKKLIEERRISIEETSIALNGMTYFAKRYNQHGGTLLLIQVDERFIGVSAEVFTSPGVEEGLHIILASLIAYED